MCCAHHRESHEECHEECHFSTTTTNDEVLSECVRLFGRAISFRGEGTGPKKDIYFGGASVIYEEGKREQLSVDEQRSQMIIGGEDSINTRRVLVTAKFTHVYGANTFTVLLYHLYPNHAFSLFINMYHSLGNVVTQKCIVGLPEYIPMYLWRSEMHVVGLSVYIMGKPFSLYTNMYHSLMSRLFLK